MSVNITFLVITGVLLAAGFYLVLERTLTRVLLGIMLLGNGINLLILTSGGRRGAAPLYNPQLSGDEYSDPLPQALIPTVPVSVPRLLLHLRCPTQPPPAPAPPAAPP